MACVFCVAIRPDNLWCGCMIYSARCHEWSNEVDDDEHFLVYFWTHDIILCFFLSEGKEEELQWHVRRCNNREELHIVVQ